MTQKNTNLELEDKIFPELSKLLARQSEYALIADFVAWLISEDYRIGKGNKSKELQRDIVLRFFDVDAKAYYKEHKDAEKLLRRHKARLEEDK